MPGMPRRRSSGLGSEDCSSNACSPTTSLTTVGPSPLVSLSQSLQHARKSADNLLATAQQNAVWHQAEAKLKAMQSLGKGDGRFEEFDLLRKLAPPAGFTDGASNAASQQRTPRLRRSWSVNPPPRAQEGGAVLASASDGELTRFLRISTAAVAEQADQLASQGAARSLDAVGKTLRQAPKNALATAQETVLNCHANLQTLGSLITRNISATTNNLLQQRGIEDVSGASKPLTWTLPFFVDQGDRAQGPFQRQVEKRKRQQQHLHDSSLREPGRHVSIVTTASLPWMTGTAVNPLLRAAYLARDGTREVTLMIPWLAKADQRVVFPNNITFDQPEQQEEFVRDWVQRRTGFESSFRIRFYPARYAAEKCSILPVGDPTQCISDEEADVAVLEEPEHLTWYHHGRRWTDKFNHVVGVIHTNYLSYAEKEEAGNIKAALLKHVNELMCRIHCHKVVKLSDAVQQLPRQVTEFVHGVPDSFLDVGSAKAAAAAAGQPAFSKGAYFIGKVLMAKGYHELLELATQHQAHGAQPLHIDCYGSGEDLPLVRAEASARHLDLSFEGPRDHLDASLHEYKVFINPSTSDVVATTTAEALAMGKWVVCADLPCNAFFSTFANCLTYKTPEEFSEKVQYALQHEPRPMAEDDRRRLTWEDATERFLDVAALDARQRPQGLEALLDTACWATHNTLTGVEPLRVGAGAGAHTRDAPDDMVNYEPETAGMGTFFDNKTRRRQY